MARKYTIKKLKDNITRIDIANAELSARLFFMLKDMGAQPRTHIGEGRSRIDVDPNKLLFALVKQVSDEHDDELETYGE